MIIDPGRHVKCVFKNGTVIEGIVKEWTDSNVQIESFNDQSIMIIVHPNEDIMLIKILPESPAQEPTKGAELREEIVAKLEEAREEKDPELQGKSLAELRQLVVTQEKQMIANKIKEHFPSAYVPHKPKYLKQINVLLPGMKGKR